MYCIYGAGRNTVWHSVVAYGYSTVETCTYTVYILCNTNNVHFCIFYFKKKILKIAVCTLQDSKYYRVEKIHTFFWETN